MPAKSHCRNQASRRGGWNVKELIQPFVWKRSMHFDQIIKHLLLKWFNSLYDQNIELLSLTRHSGDTAGPHWMIDNKSASVDNHSTLFDLFKAPSEELIKWCLTWKQVSLRAAEMRQYSRTSRLIPSCRQGVSQLGTIERVTRANRLIFRKWQTEPSTDFTDTRHLTLLL